MEFERIEEEQISIKADIHEVMMLSKLLEKPFLTVEEIKAMHDFDQIIFAYYQKRNLDGK